MASQQIWSLKTSFRLHDKEVKGEKGGFSTGKRGHCSILGTRSVWKRAELCDCSDNQKCTKNNGKWCCSQLTCPCSEVFFHLTGTLIELSESSSKSSYSHKTRARGVLYCPEMEWKTRAPKSLQRDHLRRGNGVDQLKCSFCF